ncbi:hypothetical protein GQ457_03G017140 [Hibiscus cannabinus]
MLVDHVQIIDFTYVKREDMIHGYLTSNIYAKLHASQDDQELSTKLVEDSRTMTQECRVKTQILENIKEENDYWFDCLRDMVIRFQEVEKCKVISKRSQSSPPSHHHLRSNEVVIGANLSKKKKPFNPDMEETLANDHRLKTRLHNGDMRVKQKKTMFGPRVSHPIWVQGSNGLNEERIKS